MRTANPKETELIRRLSRAGRYPHPELIEAIVQQREVMEPLVLALFRESYADHWPEDDDPRWYRFVHAGKLLLSWQTTEALPIFARLYADEAKQDWCEWFEEDLFHFGPAAIPYLQQALEHAASPEWHYGAALSGSTLSRIATYYPDERERIIAILRSQLPPLESATDIGEPSQMWGALAHELGILGDQGSQARILALDERGLLDDMFFERKAYLRGIEAGFQPEDPPPPFDAVVDYRYSHERHQESLHSAEAQQVRGQQRRALYGETGAAKPGRNDPCPCGSGKKYKLCHGMPGKV